MNSPANGTDKHVPDCNPTLLDDLKCKAQGVAAQAAYNAAHMDALTQARAAYDAARSAYGKARTTAAPTVAEVRHQLTAIIDQLKCLINDRREVDYLDRAWDTVIERLRACGENNGCYFTDDCDFDDDVKDCPPEDVPGRITEIKRRTEAAEKAFADLIQEPAALATRVAALKTEVAAIAAAMAGDAKTTDFKQLYARALVARRKLSAVWRGFEHTNAYVDCLCCALTCQLKGHTAIAVLTGIAAVHACHQASVEEGCKRLRENTVDEVMAEYIRICPPRPGNGNGGYGEPKPPRDYEEPEEPEEPREYEKPPRDYEKPRPRDYDNPPPRDYEKPPPREYDKPPQRDYDKPPPRDYRPPEPPPEPEYQEPKPVYKGPLADQDYEDEHPDREYGGGHDRDRNRRPDRGTGRSGA
jgi:hypothetical protein